MGNPAHTATQGVNMRIQGPKHPPKGLTCAVEKSPLNPDPDAQILIGNVAFRHDSVYMYCDSACF